MVQSQSAKPKHTPHVGKGSQSSRWSYLEAASWQQDFCLEDKFHHKAVKLQRESKKIHVGGGNWEMESKGWRERQS